MFKIRFFRFPTSLLHNNQYLNPESIVFFVRCLAVQIFIFEKQKFYVCVYAKYIKDDAVIYESQLKQVIGIKLQILQTIKWGLSIVNVRKKRNNFFTDIIIDQDESEEGRDCLYKSGGAVSWGHFVALPLCVLGQFSRITSAVMRLGRHHQTSSRGDHGRVLWAG